MVARIVAKTRVDNIRPLGEAGQRSYDFIVGSIERVLTPRHAALFAEPTDQAGSITWMSEASGPIRNFRALSPGDAERLRGELGRLVEDVMSLADRYAGEADPAAQSLAIALRNAVEIPNDECIFQVGDQPVIVQWAHHLDLYDPPRGVLSRMIASAARVVLPSQSSILTEEAGHVAAPVGAATAEIADVDRMSAFNWLWWLGWLTLAFLIFWLLWLALPACGVSVPWMANNCAHADDSRSADERGETAALEAGIAALEREIASAERQCIASVPPSTPPKSSIEEIIREGDESKLAGCWDLDSDYTLYVGGKKDKPVKVKDWRVCFDDKGVGAQDITFTSGNKCHGSVTASFEGQGKLSILDDGPVPCDTSQIVQRLTVCEINARDRASCKSANVNRKDAPGASVTLRRSQ